MIRAWNIAPVDMRTLGAIQEVPVIDRIGMLIDRHENLGRPVNSGKLEPLTVSGKERVYSLRPGVRGNLAERTKKRVHAEAPGATGITFCALRAAHIDVRRALINSEIFAKVLRQDPVLDVLGVEVAPLVAGIPIHHVVDPIDECPLDNGSLGFRDTEVVHHLVHVVVRVQSPSHHELLAVIETHDGLRFLLGTVQDGQQHGGQDGDDGDDDQQFDQGEAAGVNATAIKEAGVADR